MNPKEFLVATPAPVLKVRHTAGAAVVALRVVVPGGADVELLPGLAAVTGQGLTEGTRRRSWRQVAEDAEALGASVGSAGSFEALGLSIDAMAADWPRVLEWAAELLLEPIFPSDRCLWLARQAAAELDSLADQPDVVAHRAFLEQLYSPHPRRRPAKGDGESLSRVDGPLCAELYRQHLATSPLLVAVAGPVDEAAVTRRLEALLSERQMASAAYGEPAGDRPLPFPSPPAPLGLPQRRREVKLPGGGDQAHVYVGQLTVPSAHEDATALQVLAVILGAGGGLSGRIPQRIREREGLAYSAYAHTMVGAGRDPGRLTLYAGTSAANAGRAETGLVEELERLLQDGVDEVEVSEARNFLLGREPFRQETPRQVAGLLVDAAFYDLPLDDRDWRRRALEAVDRAAVEAAAQRWLRPDQLHITIGLP